MKSDITKSTFRSKKHYKSVRMQQGRVQLDADWNEQADILLHRIETGTRDLLGKSGGTNESDGFRIVTSADRPDDFDITPGRYYVNGILCENDGLVSFLDQPDRRGLDASDARDVLGPEDGLYLVYLDVWTRQLTHLDDEDLREPALGGADTTTRAKVVWQVRCEPLASLDALPPSDSLPASPERVRETTGTLAVRSNNAQLFNQLYRIEIAESGARGEAVFKWSRDNAAVVALVDVAGGLSGANLSLKISDKRFQKGDWIEIVTETDELEGSPDSLASEERNRFCRIKNLSGNEIELDREHLLEALAGTQEVIKIRRWDVDPQRAADEEPPLFSLAPEADSDGWVELENGIAVQFSEGNYKQGDYWYVPIRVADETPQVRPAAPVDGVLHPTAHLAVVRRSGGSLTLERDLRRRYIPPGDDRGVMYAGGDGQVTPRGTVLPEPLAVYVTGYIGRADVVVRFSLPDGAPGGLYASNPASTPGPSQTAQEVETDGDGVARCWWMPMDTDHDGVVPAVTATLRESGETETGNAIRFNAWLSNADQVDYDTAHNGAVGTVEEGLDDLYEQVTKLHHVSGEGQVARGGEVLAEPLVVELSGYTPASGKTVRFALPTAESAGELWTLEPSEPEAVFGKSVEVETDEDGRAMCYWKLPEAGSGESVPPVTATLLDELGQETAHKVGFSAWTSEAEQVRYYLSDRAKDAQPEAGEHASAEQVLDNVYENLAALHYVGGDGQSGWPGVTLEQPLRVRLGNGAWASGTTGEPRVRFRIVSGAGRLTTGGEFLTELDGVLVAGEYQCYWRLDDAIGPHEVEAFAYFDGDVATKVTPLRFTAQVLAAGTLAYENPAHNGAVETVEGGLDDLYEQVTKLHHVSGEGQVARGGEVLAEPLVVELSGYTPASGKSVRFALPTAESDGELWTLEPSEPGAVSGKSVEVETDADGRAMCYWKLPNAGSGESVPPVTATLLDEFGQETAHKVGFSAWMSEAEQVRYYLSDRAKDAQPEAGEHASAEAVLDNVYENLATLHYVGGDGQSGWPGVALEQPLRVRLGNGAWASGATGEPRVRFRIVSGAGRLTTGGEFLTELDGALIAGEYQCYWRLDDAIGPHEVEAFAYFDGDVTTEVTPLRFTAQVLASSTLAYENPAHNGAVETVEEGLDDLYEQVTKLHHVSGESQVARGGEVLAEPLVVELSGHTPASGKTVRFALPTAESAGELWTLEPSEPGAVSGKSVEVETDADGRAMCYWKLPDAGSGEIAPPVTATLLDEFGQETAHKVGFSAWMSEAEQVRYHLSDRAKDAQPEAGEHASAEEVLDNVYENLATLHYVGGDGQSGWPGVVLGQPLRVRIGNGAWASGTTGEPRVRFRIVSGGGELTTGEAIATEVDGELREGVYECNWQLGDATGPHEVEAFAYFDGDVTTEVTPLRFTAQVLASSTLAYENPEHNANVRTVADALDDLYEGVSRLHHVSGDGQSGLHGEVLEQPLVVELTGYAPGSGWSVNFTLPALAGELHEAEPSEPSPEPVESLIVPLDEFGRAVCYWRMPAAGAGEAPLRVTATVQDGELPTGHEVIFHAHLREAEQVRYALSKRAQDALPGRGEHLSAQQALDEVFTHLAVLHSVGGNGQSGEPDEELLQPLQVRLGNGDWASGTVDPPRVRFRVVSGGGDLSTSQASSQTEVDAELIDGVHQCRWRLGNEPGPHEVVAFALYDGESVEMTPVRFTAHRRDAAAMAYADSRDAAVTNVEQALQTLYTNQRVLAVESGAGQAGAAGQPLSHPLRVSLAHGQWSSIEEVPQIRFSAVGGGRLASSQSGPFTGEPVEVNPLEGLDGVYECWWELGASGAQEVRAEVVFTGTPNLTVEPVVFFAHLLEAEEISYQNAAVSPVTTVKEGLDQLFSQRLPVGSIVEYASSIELVVPQGFLLCDGQSVSRDTYSALFAVIGTTFGVEGDETLFKLPTLTGSAENIHKLVKY